MSRPVDRDQSAPAEAARERETQTVRIGPVLRRGCGVARADSSHSTEISVPFSLPGELVEAASTGVDDQRELLRVVESSPERVEPCCPHFGACGGCHLQMASEAEQIRLKQNVLLERLERAGVREVPPVQVHSAPPWGYRNRIRLRVGRDATGALRLGYNKRGSRRFLPVRVCPISTPLLLRAAEALLAGCATTGELHAWVSAAAEVEIFADDRLERLQLLLLLDGKAPANSDATFAQAMGALRAELPELAGAGAVLLGPEPRGRERVRERTRTPVASWGAAGLASRSMESAAGSRGEASSRSIVFSCRTWCGWCAPAAAARRRGTFFRAPVCFRVYWPGASRV